MDSFRRDGLTYRVARVGYVGTDFNIARPLLDLPGAVSGAGHGCLSS